jgi:hypothetical protein
MPSNCGDSITLRSFAPLPCTPSVTSITRNHRDHPCRRIQIRDLTTGIRFTFVIIDTKLNGMTLLCEIKPDGIITFGLV